MDTTRAAPLMRRRDGHGGSRVTTLELFFDLVFVFAVTQLSHFLLEHFSPLGAVQTLMLLMAVWWVWVFTAWATNWLDPDQRPVRLMIIALMLAGLLLAAALPGAFSERGLAFAAAYVAMQVGRTAFALWAMWGDAQRENFRRILVWLSAGGALWLAGGLASGPVRVGLWLLALAVEYTSPALGFAVPGLGRSTTRDWTVSGAHLSERAGLFVIIALGESLLLTGATFAELEWTLPTVAALVTAFAGSVALWWTYFLVNAQAGAASIEASDDPALLGRAAYTYVHVLIVAGIVLSAVGDELVLAHPTGTVDPQTLIAVVGGPLVFLVGNLVFKWEVTGEVPSSHVGGLVVLCLLAALAFAMSPVALSLLTVAVLVGVASWEGRRRPRPVRPAAAD